MNDARTTLQADIAAAVTYLPHVAAALVILVVGGALALGLGRLARALAERIGLDRLGERRGLQDDLRTIGVRASLSRLLGRAVAAAVALATLVQVVEALQLASIEEALRSLLAFVPHVFVAVVILVLAGLLANILGDAAASTAERSGVRGDATIGTLVRGLVLVSAALMALQQLAIDASFLFDVLLVALGGTILALSLAIGWGARRMMENVAAARYVEQNFAAGDTIACEDVVGTVDGAGLTSATIVAADGERLVVPNAWFVTRVVRKRGSSLPSDAGTGGLAEIDGLSEA